jgi:hypothetical protein
MTVNSPEGQRIAPQLPAAAMQTFRLSAPPRTHTRAATCEEVGCEAYRYGWATTVLPDSQEEATIRSSGRHWASRETTPEGFVRYVFPPGQSCFAASAHRVSLEREPNYVLVGGDWRGNPAGLPPRQMGPDEWTDRLQEATEV